MTYKEIALREAYGEYADIAGGLMDENGYIPTQYYYSYFPQNTEECVAGKRPVALIGIETNNGWTRIESFETVQIQAGKFKIGNLTPERWIEFGGVFDSVDVIKYYAKGEISHFRLIPENLKPLY